MGMSTYQWHFIGEWSGFIGEWSGTDPRICRAGARDNDLSKCALLRCSLCSGFSFSLHDISMNAKLIIKETTFYF